MSKKRTRTEYAKLTSIFAKLDNKLEKEKQSAKVFVDKKKESEETI